MKNEKLEKIRKYKGSLKDFADYWNDRMKSKNTEKPLKESRAFLSFKEFLKKK